MPNPPQEWIIEDGHGPGSSRVRPPSVAPAGAQWHDGDILYYAYIALDSDRERWLSMLNTHKRRVLTRLQRTPAIKTFVELLRYRGLWSTFTLGCLNNILSLHMEDEILEYLKTMEERWRYILGEDMRPEDLDTRTVNELETLMPAISDHDRTKVNSLIRTGVVFRGLTLELRLSIRSRLEKSSRILTMGSFTEDKMCLEVCYPTLGDMVTGCPRGPLRQRMRGIYRLHEQHFRANYIDVWLAVLRDFPYLTGDSRHKALGRKGPKPPARARDPLLIDKIWSRAQYLGFAIDRPDGHSITALAERTDVQGRAMELNHTWTSAKKPSLHSERGDVPRCNRPDHQDLDSVQRGLYLEHIYDGFNETGPYPSAFAVARDIVHCFWGAKVPDDFDNVKARTSEAGDGTAMTSEGGNDTAMVNSPSERMVFGRHFSSFMNDIRSRSLSVDIQDASTQRESSMVRPSSSVYQRAKTKSPVPASSMYSSVVSYDMTRALHDRQDPPLENQAQRAHRECQSLRQEHDFHSQILLYIGDGFLSKQSFPHQPDVSLSRGFLSYHLQGERSFLRDRAELMRICTKPVVLTYVFETPDQLIELIPRDGTEWNVVVENFAEHHGLLVLYCGLRS